MRSCVLALAALLLIVAPAQAAERSTAFGSLQSTALAAAAPPAGFTESVAVSGLAAPASVRFAPDGRMFVGEKRGRILMFDSLSDLTPTVWADFSTSVHDFWDRGFLGMALDPNFATRPYVYALYAYNKDPSSAQFPRWPDSCPTPPGATGDGCVIGGRLSRFSAGGVEQVLIEDFCQQYPSHSTGSLAFGADGALYVSSGDGASFNFADYGQDGNPVNPCGDPPGGVGGAMTAPTAEGGALRSQDVRTTGDPTGLDGAILRVNPDTGAALPDNPNAGSPDPNARRIVAHGLRNPFRIAVRPGTNEVWSGDVGWNVWEEINRLQNPTGSLANFGWPCYEGGGRQSGYDNLDLNLCETLYAQGPAAHAAPYYAYNHSSQVVAGETCPTGSSSISGLAFYTGGSFGPAYDGALFFSDYSRNCIWVMLRGANGLPDPATRQTFVAGAAGPVELQIGPDGDLYYVDMGGGTIRRIRGSFSNEAPTAVAGATPSSGAVPLTVAFDGRASTDPNAGTTLTYAWDLDGDGEFDDSTSATPSRTYTSPGVVTVRLRVSDGELTDTTTLSVTAGTPPDVSIDSPVAGTTWAVDDTITYDGSATDFLGAPIAAGSLSWRVLMQHCNRTGGSCHTHVLQTLPGIGGSLVAPEHEYPSYLELELTATDAYGLSRTVTRRLDPRTVPITVASDPAGVALTLGTETAIAPLTLEVIEGSQLPVTAPSQATVNGETYEFAGWSDGGGRTHDITVGTAPATFTASFQPPPAALAVTPATLSFTATAGGANPAGRTLSVANTGGGTLSFTASSDAPWLSVSPGSGTAPAELIVSTEVAGLAPGTYNATVTVNAPGADGSPRDVPVTLAVAPPATGLVGAWGFDERVGRQVLDASGAGNPGTLSGATRTRGRFGGGLWFDGRNDWVTVAGDRSLDLSGGMTLAAWVRPLARGRTVVVKESVNRLSYGLYARPSGHVFTTAEHALRGRALKRKRWSHLAMTWDGLIMRVYVNGAEASRATLIGTAKTAAGPLRIGGNAIWPEFFKGTIDEVRIYDRALTAAEIVRARDTAITPGAPQPHAHETTSRGKPRKTRRATHRTRWLTAAGAAARAG